MANELITGANGSGKTCYAVAKRMQEEVGREIEYEDQFGVTHTAKRRILAAGFRQLLIEHERLPHPLTGEVIDRADIDRWNKSDRNDQPVLERLPFQPPVLFEVVDGKEISLVCCLFNWWLWIMPGDMLCVDEIQYLVPRGVLGRTPPLWMRKIEMHRHYGMDFLFITPHPQLIDMQLRALINPHRHVRAVSFMPKLSAVYVWDHASNPERLTNAVKEKFVKRAKYFKLYKSTTAVMRQPAASSTYLYIAPLVLGLAVWLGWNALHPKSKAAPVVSEAQAAAPSRLRAALPKGVQRPPGWLDVPKLTGCYSVGSTCSCIGEEGRPVQVAEAMCRTSAAGFAGLVLWEKRDPPPKTPYGASAAPAAPASAGGFNPLKTALLPDA